jgi:hypothetical protein
MTDIKARKPMRSSLLALCVACFTQASAAEKCPTLAEGPTGEYLVSGVLQKKGTTDVKLVHTVRRALSESEALAGLAAAAAEQYVDYNLVSYLVSPILITATACWPSIPTKLHGKDI